MLAADELVELRELQARAYGRGGTLSGADAARLRELERRRIARESSTVSSADPASRGRGGLSMMHSSVPRAATVRGTAEMRESPRAIERSADPATGADAGAPTALRETAEGPDTSAGPASLVASLRALWRPVSIIVVLMLALGVGVGWLLFGRAAGAEALELTAEQQRWHDEILATAEYDQGSLRALEETGGVVIWVATTDVGQRMCLVMGTDDRAIPFCDRIEQALSEGLHGTFTIDREGTRTEIIAQVLFTETGEAAIRTDQYVIPASSVGMTYANEEENRIAENLVELGYDPQSIWVVGYDGEVPIWTATLLETQEMCLVYDGSAPDPRTACQAYADFVPGGEGISLSVVDSETGATTEIEYSANGPQYLVITKSGGAA
jgi:hypothetical protein